MSRRIIRNHALAAASAIVVTGALLLAGCGRDAATSEQVAAAQAAADRAEAAAQRAEKAAGMARSSTSTPAEPAPQATPEVTEEDVQRALDNQDNQNQ